MRFHQPLMSVLMTALCSQVNAQIPYGSCFHEAAARYEIDKRMLVAIAKTESGLRAGSIGPKNANGTYDIGLMQINSAWLPTLSKYGITESNLKNACTNIHVGAWIFAQNIQAHGPTWKAVGAYNARTPSKQAAYANKVNKNYALVGALVQ